MVDKILSACKFECKKYLVPITVAHLTAVYSKNVDSWKGAGCPPMSPPKLQPKGQRFRDGYII